MVRRGQVYDDDDMYDWDDEEGDEEDWDAPVQHQPKGPVKGGAAARGAAAASAKPEKAAAAQHRATHPIAPPPPLPSSLPVRPATVIVQPWQAGPQTLAPSLLPAFAFTTPSPDDHVLAAQRGVGGSGSLIHPAGRAAPDNGSPVGLTSTAGSTAGGQPGPAAAAAGTPPPTQAGGGIKKGLVHLPVSKAMLAANEKQAAAAAAAQESAGAQGTTRGPHASTSTQGQGRGSTSADLPAAVTSGLGPDGHSNGRGAGWEASQGPSQGDGGEAGPGRGQAGAAAAVSVQSRRRVAEYVLEPDLARECAAMASLEAAACLGPAPGTSTASLEAAAGGSPTPKLGLHLVVLGHVDAGKSTLMGRLLHDLGCVTAKEVHKNQREAAAVGKESFSWAWLLDERPEERSRGVTVDVATARFATPRFNVTLLDAPGHRDFVSNMIGGAAQADAALLVVDGAPGGFEAGFEGSGAAGAGCGQTKEHAQLARSLGVEQLAVVVTKLDVAGYDQARYDSIKARLAPFLKQTCGFKDAQVQWLPAVGPSGDNLVDLAAGRGLGAWWRGPTLVQAIDRFRARERLTGKPLRLPVTDMFKNKAGALVLSGKVEAGALRPGTKLLLQPGLHQAAVRAVEVDGKPATLARAGDAVELAVTGLNLDRLPGGSTLCHPDWPVPLATKFQARVLVLDVAVPLLKGASITLHAHIAREPGVISALISTLNARTGEVVKQRPRCLLQGQTAMVELTAQRGMPVEEYSDLKALGRIAIRDGGHTLAVGIITQLLA